MATTLLCRLLVLSIVHTRTLTLLLGLHGITLGIGFALGDITDLDYTAVIQFAKPVYWAIGLWVYGILKVLQALSRMPATIKLLNALQGIWAWSFLFISFSIIDTAPITPTELLLVVPILCEVWELVVAIFNSRIYPRRRKDDIK